MARSTALLASLVAAVAWGQPDARTTFLLKQLRSARDARVRAQTAVILGASKSPAAVQPLCQALGDPEALVRTASAKALGDLGDRSASACLKLHVADRDPAVQLSVAKALEQLEGQRPTRGALYAAIDPVVDAQGQFGADTLALTEKLLRDELQKRGASLAPARETQAAAEKAIRAHQLRGYLLKANLLPHGGGGLRIDLLVLTYPGRAIQGSWSIKASGADPPDLLRVMVPQVLDDAAEDLEWKRP